MEIHIKKKEKNVKGYWAIEGLKGERYTAWDEKVAQELVEGNSYDVEITTVKKGNFTYHNITKVIKKTSWLDVEEKKEVGGIPAIGGDTPERRYRSMALAYAKDILVALIETNKVSAEEPNNITNKVISTADIFYDYIVSGQTKIPKDKETPQVFEEDKEDGKTKTVLSQKITIGKHKGKTWNEVLCDPETRAYIFWAAHNATNLELKEPAEKIIKAFPDDFSQTE